MEPNLPKTKVCHCTGTAHKYRVRSFSNQLGYKVYRVFFRCENCFSRINEDFSPEFDAIPKLNVLDVLEKIRKEQ